MIKLPSLLLLLMILAELALMSSCTPKPQEDCGFVQNVYGQRISWKSSSGPTKIYIHSSVPEQLRPGIYRAAATWESQIGHKLFDITEDSSQISAVPSRDQKNVIYFLDNWESDRTSEQGRTSVYWAGDEIYEADIRINASDFSYYDQNPQVLIGSYKLKQQDRLPSEGYNFEALVLHEMGHFLGLKHREGQTVMATHLSAYDNRTQLSGLDQQSVACSYK